MSDEFKWIRAEKKNFFFVIDQSNRTFYFPSLPRLSLSLFFFLPSNVRLEFQKTIPAIGTFRERAMFIEQIGQK